MYPRATSSIATTATNTHPENPTNIHVPIDIGDRHLKTRNMFRKRRGRPRSEINNAGQIDAPISPTQSAKRMKFVGASNTCAANAIHAEIPEVPPRKKYSGTSQVQVGGFNRDRKSV